MGEFSERAMPCNAELEQEILSKLINEKECSNYIMDKVSHEDFYYSKNKNIYKVVSSMICSGMNPKSTAHLITMVGKENLNKIGGISYYTDVMYGGCCGDYKIYVENLKKLSYRRRAILEMNKCIQKLYEDDSDHVKNVEDTINKVTYEEDKKTTFTDREGIIDYAKTLEKRFNSKEPVTGIKCGVDPIDKYTCGLYPGTLTVIAGRPAMGKTAIALRYTDGIASINPDKKVLMFSLEMNEDQLYGRRLAAMTDVDSSRIKSGEITDVEFEKICESMNYLSKKNNVIIDYESGVDIGYIERKCRSIKRSLGLDVVIIDHLSIMDVGNSDTRVGITNITRRLKVLSKKLNVAIVLLSQLSRSCEMRNDKRPIMSDLRDSGSIEQDADNVYMLYRDEYYNPETEDKNILEFLVRKNREGPNLAIKLYYNRKTQFIGKIVRDGGAL